MTAVGAASAPGSPDWIDAVNASLMEATGSPELSERVYRWARQMPGWPEAKVDSLGRAMPRVPRTGQPWPCRCKACGHLWQEPDPYWARYEGGLKCAECGALEVWVLSQAEARALDRRQSDYAAR